MITSCPTAVLPVNDNNLIRGSFDISLPICAPPTQSDATDPGTLQFSNTWAIILVIATAIKGVVEAGFHNNVSPHT